MRKPIDLSKRPTISGPYFTGVNVAIYAWNRTTQGTNNSDPGWCGTIQSLKKGVDSHHTKANHEHDVQEEKPEIL